MATSPVSLPPPEIRNTPPPPSVFTMQGKQQAEADSNPLQQNVVDQLVAGVMELKNAAEKLSKLLAVVKPEAQALMMPIVQAGKALEQEIKEVIQQAKPPQAASPMMGQPGAGMPPGGGSPNPAEGMPTAA